MLATCCLKTLTCRHREYLQAVPEADEWPTKAKMPEKYIFHQKFSNEKFAFLYSFFFGNKPVFTGKENWGWVVLFIKFKKKQSIIAKEQIRIFQAALSVIMLLTVGNSLSVVGKAKIADGYFRPLCPECLCSTTKPAQVRVKPSSLLPWSLPVLCRSAAWQADRAAEAGRQRAPNPPSSHHQGWTLVSGLGCNTGACLFTRIFCLTSQPCDLFSKK